MTNPAWAIRPSVVAQPRTAAVVVDGSLTETAWQNAVKTAGLTERKPALGSTPVDSTRFALLCDSQTLWIAVWCDDSQPDAIAARTTARDTFALFADDAISIKIDANLDLRTTYGFALNPAGARLDYRGVDEAEMRIEADAVWLGAATRTATGWTAEFAIAWTSLGLDPEALPAEIGLNLSRDHSRRNATYDWALMPPPYSPVSASLYGRATGIASAARQGGMGLSAAATPSADAAEEASASTATAEAGPTSVAVPYALGGVEVKNGVASPVYNAGVDWSGQLWQRARGHLTVNTDFAQVDLDDRVVNLGRFSLFMPEKRDFFLKDVDLFAVGRPKSMQLFYSRNIGLRAGGVVPILAGLKIAGQMGQTGRYGLLQIVTGTPRDPDEVTGVLRGVADLGGGSKLGAMATHRLGQGTVNLAAGLDGTLRAADSKLLTEAFAMASSADGEPAAAGGVDVQWRGLLVRPKLSYTFAQDKFAPALGFVQRTGIHDGSFSLAVEPRIGAWGVEKINCDTRLKGIATLSGDRVLDRSWGGGCGLVWNSGWNVSAGGELASVTALQPFAIGANTPIAAGQFGASGGGIEFNSPEVGNLVVFAGLGRQQLFGGHDVGAGGGVTIRAGRRLRLEVSTEGHQVQMPEPTRSFWSATLNARAAIGISPDLNLDVYAGWNRLAQQVIAQARLRWTWRQASDVFVVWQEQVATSPWAIAASSVMGKVTWAVF